MKKYLEKTLQLFLLVLGLLTVAVGGGEFIRLFDSSQSISDELDGLGQSFQQSWNRDFEEISQNHSDILATVGSIKIMSQSELIQVWAPYLQTPLNLDESAPNYLEIVAITWEEGDIIAAVMEYSIYNPTTNELLWETTRTVYIRGSEEEFEQQSSK